MGMAPTERRTRPKIGTLNRPSRAQKATWRRSIRPSSSGSMMEFGWFDARIAGRAPSRCSLPVTSMVR